MVATTVVFFWLVRLGLGFPHRHQDGASDRFVLPVLRLFKPRVLAVMPWCVPGGGGCGKYNSSKIPEKKRGLRNFGGMMIVVTFF